MLKFGRSGERPAAKVAAATADRLELGHAARRDVLYRLSKFLLDCQLDVNPANLALAHAVASGTDPELNRRIAARQRDKEPITQAWLDDVIGVTKLANHAEVREPEARQPEAGADAGTDHPAVEDSARVLADLDREYRAAREAGEPLAIAVCEIDRFAAINETHGQATGDRVIQAIARALQRISSASYHISRDGGEAFVLSFRGTPDETRNLLDTARETFARRKLIDRKTHVAIGSVTFSGGVTDALAHGSAQAALKAADDSLTQAREQGRNQIVVAL